MEEKEQPIQPEVGMGATAIGFTDRYPYTVIEVHKSGKRCKVQEDHAKRLDKNGMSENQSYAYTPNPDGTIVEISRRKNGAWIEVGGGGARFHVGSRRKYHDYSF